MAHRPIVSQLFSFFTDDKFDVASQPTTVIELQHIDELY